MPAGFGGLSGDGPADQGGHFAPTVPTKATPPVKAIAAAPVAAVAVDPKSPEGQLIAAQGQIVAGNLDAGLKIFAEARAKAAPALAPRIGFVQKLVEIRVADRLGNQPKVAPGLAEAMKQATKPDQVAACWQLGLGLARAAVTAKSPAAAGLIDFLVRRPPRRCGRRARTSSWPACTWPPAVRRRPRPNWVAAPRANSPAERAAWTTAVADLAKAVDAGQAPKAGTDLFERLHAAAPAALQAALDVVEGGALLNRGELASSQAVFERAVTAAKTAKEQSLVVVSLGYNLSATLAHKGNATDAADLLAKADAFAQSLPASAERDRVLVTSLVACGQAARAADVAWKAALGAKIPAQRQQMLLLYAHAAVAAGQEAGLAAKLQSMKAPAGVFTTAANALAQIGKAQAALAVVEAVPAAALVNDAQAAADVVSVMRQVHQQEKQMGARQAARCRAVAVEYAAAAKRAADSQEGPAGGSPSQAGGRLPGPGHRSPEVRRTLQHPPPSPARRERGRG